MHTAGVVPEDAPDPRLERAEKLKAMPVPVVSLVDQPALEVMDIGVSSGSDGAGYWMMAASVTSTLWRNPADKSDPANLAELDDTTRRALDEVPPWPRPAWLVDQIERMRYPIMWEAVQTTWHREQSDRTTVDYLLVHHTNHILMNQFREAHGLGLSDWESPALASSRSIRHGIDLVIDGKRVSGAEIDTDPFVYAVGAKLGSGATLTAVIAREHLPYIDLAFASGRRSARERLGRAAPASSRWGSFGHMSFDDVVQVLDETAVVAVVTTKADGQRVATPIWSMVIDGVPYVRSVNGAGAWWYRHVHAGRPVAFVLGDGSIAERDRAAALDLPREQVTTTYVPVDDPVQAKIDDELWRKYAGSPESVRAMLSDDARSCTLRIEAAS